jgi:hypothetical protein
VTGVIGRGPGFFPRDLSRIAPGWQYRRIRPVCGRSSCGLVEPPSGPVLFGVTLLSGERCPDLIDDDETLLES